MSYYIEYNEIPMFNLLKIFETNNYKWMYEDYYDDTSEYNFTNVTDSKVEHYFLLIIGELNCLERDDVWRGLLEYSGLLHKIHNNKGDLSENLNNLKEYGKLIINLMLEENKKIEDVLKEELDFKNLTLFDWLVIRENTL